MAKVIRFLWVPLALLVLWVAIATYLLCAPCLGPPRATGAPEIEVVVECSPRPC